MRQVMWKPGFYFVMGKHLWIFFSTEEQQGSLYYKGSLYCSFKFKERSVNKICHFPQLSLPRKVHGVDLFRFNYSWGFIRQRKN